MVLRKKGKTFDEPRNQRLYILSYLLTVLGGGLCAEGYIQAFMLAGGMGIEGIGLYGMLTNVAMLAAYGVFPFLRAKGNVYLKMLCICSVFIVAYPVGLTVLSFLQMRTPPTQMLMLAVGMAYAFLSAVRASSEFSVIPNLFSRSAYGVLMGKGGMIGGILALGVSTAGAYCLGNAGAMMGYSVFFGLAILVFGAAAFIPFLYRAGQEDLVENVSEQAMGLKAVKQHLSWRYFWILLPHFLRGIGMAGMYYFVVIGLEKLPESSLISSGIVAVGTCSNMLGNLFFMKKIGKIRSGKMVLWANIVCAVCMAVVPWGLNALAFFAVYLIYGMANIISQAGVPVGVLQSTPTQDLPFISSARMFACSGATCVMIPLFGAWIKQGMAGMVMIAAAFLFVAAGLFFNRQYADKIK